MSGVRVLVGTRKGAFVFTSDGKRKNWEISGPHFAGWEIYHVKGSPADPDRLYASQSSGWFGQMMQRSNDGGKTWEAGRQRVQVRRHAGHAPVVRRHAAPLGVQARLASRAVADRSRCGLRRRGGCRALPLGRRRPHMARAARAARPRVRSALAAGCGRHVPAHDHRRSQESRSDLHRDLGGGRVSNRRRRQRPGGRSTAACIRSTFPTRTPRSATASTASR